MIRPIVSSSSPITLIGGANPAPDALTVALKWGETVVCADGGADMALLEGLNPAAVVGDMDSISESGKHALRDVLHPICEQDSTDLDKALRNIEAPLVLGVGFSGARLDHELAALTVLVRYPERPCILIGEETFCLLCPPEINLDLEVGSLVSLFPMADVGCSSEGLHWPTDGLRLAPDGRVGTSNKATGPVTLRPDAPKLLLILPRGALELTVQALLQGSGRWPARAG
ncbi:thiamine diphosphokinase [Octadecabacter sp. 1_MG-2023]|uniref:thiamine diphosphokinase n=1 Tax=unclassified Octadecabacter TaxID=196158 RepID=UPI001C08A6B5|nr:thiamine diphosphokinase [Octadecabacter sp. 1_MG-2023]MBU2992864.1 thiamine diphosphokinase [Octadecabacter sp. B2R22]MDO6733685.1 thiamine diphosphokinase [Octadecabacter sp. 1_MG-2023]